MFSKLIKATVIVLVLAFTVVSSKHSKAKQLSVDDIYKQSDTINLIAGGQIVKEPMLWVGAIYKEESRALNKEYSNCTGEFINKYYVLSAAHCTLDKGKRYIISTFVHSNPIVVESYIFDGAQDIVLLKLAKPFVGIKQVDLYHNYYIDAYKDFDTVESVLQFGYGLLAPGVYNTSMNLYYAPIKFNKFFYNLNMIQFISPSNIGGLPGDSGGPITYSYKFKHMTYKKLVAVSNNGFISGSNKYQDAILLNDSILSWISKETGRVIFQYPIDSGYIALESNSISIYGWGKVTKLSKVLVYNDSDPDPVAACKDINIDTISNQWKCRAIFIDGYNFEKHLNYQVNIQDNGEILDFVNFKIKRSALDLKILHPTSEFVYHSPENYTYLISGTGTPGKHISSHLVDLASREIYFNPCIPNSQPIINQSGTWDCRIKVLNNKATPYKFTVRYLESFIIQDPNLPKDILDTVTYSVNPLNIKPFIKIESPYPNEIVFPTYRVKLKFSNFGAGIAKKLIYNVEQPDNHFSQSVETSKIPQGNNWSFPIQLSRYVPGVLNDILFYVYIVIDEDKEPIVNYSVSHYLAVPAAALTHLQESNTVTVGQSLLVDGRVFYYDKNRHPVPTNIGKVKVTIIKDNKDSINFGCGELLDINQDSTWHCPNALILNNPGQYIVNVKIYANIGRDNIWFNESLANIIVKSTQESVEFKHPHSL